jgi:hypothetical protein
MRLPGEHPGTFGRRWLGGDQLDRLLVGVERVIAPGHPQVAAEPLGEQAGGALLVAGQVGGTRGPLEQRHPVQRRFSAGQLGGRGGSCPQVKGALEPSGTSPLLVAVGLVGLTMLVAAAVAFLSLRGRARAREAT